jgi:hypothetical protein
LSNGHPTHRLTSASANLTSAVASRRAERTALWQDSSLFQDSFFAPDSRVEGFSPSEFGGLAPDAPVSLAQSSVSTRVGGENDDEIAGVVIDTPTAVRPTHH